MADQPADDTSRPGDTTNDRGTDAAPGDRPAIRSQVDPILLADLATEFIDVSEATLTEGETDDMLEQYLSFLRLSDAARLGDEEADAALDLITDPLIRYLTEDWKSRNEQLAGDGLAVTGLFSTPNIRSISGSAAGVVVHDCVVQQVTDQFTGVARTEYVEQFTVLRNVEGLWLVSLVEVLHDGSLESGPIRCVSHAEQAAVGAVATQVLDGITEAWADPQSGVDHLRPVVGQALAERMSNEIGRMVDEGTSVVGEQTHAVHVVGANLLAEETTYVVVSCTTFPAGLQPTAVDGVEAARGEEPVGGTVYREWSAATIDGKATDVRMMTLDSQQVGIGCEDEVQP